jgi:hypothetical protein
MLISRISRRVLAEHHIALSKKFGRDRQESSGEPQVGIIYTGLNVKRSIERCTQLLRERPIDVEDRHGGDLKDMGPAVVIDGHPDTTFAYIREHLEYA